MSRTNTTTSAGDLREVPASLEWEAYERLPKPVREWLGQRVHSYSALDLYNHWRRGAGLAEIIRSVELQDVTITGETYGPTHPQAAQGELTCQS